MKRLLRIHEAVERGRRNEAWRLEYMRELVVLQDAKDEGIEIGREEGILAFIREKKDDGIGSEVILGKLQKYYHLSVEDAKRYMSQA